MLSNKTKFNIAMIISLSVHFVVLTVLFVPKPKDDEIKYTELKIKFGSNKDTRASGGGAVNVASIFPQSQPETSETHAEKASDEQGTADAGKVVYRGDINQPQQPAKAEEKLEQTVIAKNEPAPAEPEVIHSDEKPVREEVQQAEAPKPQAKPKKIIAVQQPAAKKMVIPARRDTFDVSDLVADVGLASNRNDESEEAEYDQYMEPEEEYTILGNSLDKKAGRLTSYEQVLPLWLDKFKKYPEDARRLGIEGSADVFIKINRSGKILLSSIKKGTGYQLLDDALVKMIKDADPVVPVPPDYYRDKKTFSYLIRFDFRKDGE